MWTPLLQEKKMHNIKRFLSMDWQSSTAQKKRKKCNSAYSSDIYNIILKKIIQSHFCAKFVQDDNRELI